MTLEGVNKPLHSVNIRDKVVATNHSLVCTTVATNELNEFLAKNKENEFGEDFVTDERHDDQRVT